MKQEVFEADDKHIFYIAEADSVEDGDPIEETGNVFINALIMHFRTANKLKGNSESLIFIEAIKRLALRTWDEELAKLMKIDLPIEYWQLLNCDNKKEQEKLLKKIVLTPKELSTFIFKAYQEHGFKYSFYRIKHRPKDFDESKMPRFAHAKDGLVRKVGETQLSDGQIKNMIIHKKELIIKFIQKGDLWHCFFSTYKGLNGEETGYQHWHYTSSSFTKSKEEVLQQFHKKQYSISSFHVRYNDNERTKK